MQEAEVPPESVLFSWWLRAPGNGAQEFDRRNEIFYGVRDRRVIRFNEVLAQHKGSTVHMY